MKKGLFFMLFALPFVALMFAVSSKGNLPVSKDGVQPPVPSDAVAVLINGTAHLLTNQVIWTFPGGGTIESITFFVVGQQPYMRRTGVGANGNSRSETFKVEISNGFLVYRPTVVHLCTPLIPLTSCIKCEYKVVESRCDCQETQGIPGNDGCNLDNLNNFPGELVVVTY